MTMPAAAQATVSQSHGSSQAETSKTSAPPMQMDSPETEQQHYAYLHSPAVHWVAKKFGLSVETTSRIFEWLNSGIVLFVIFYFLFKMLPGIFRRRTERLQKDLLEAKNLSDDAKHRLAAIEERMSHLDAEIEAFRKRSEHESAEEERRMHTALETERKRIVHSAEQEIEAAGAMAQRSLQRYAADLAVGHVRENLKVDANRDKALVAEFAKSIEGQQKGGRN
jgi:F-type H+-transporting ATPase subunit b